MLFTILYLFHSAHAFSYINKITIFKYLSQEMYHI